MPGTARPQWRRQEHADSRIVGRAIPDAGTVTVFGDRADSAGTIDRFTKVFWRDEPVSHLWPQVLVLLAAGVVLCAIARRLARRWEYP
jgi:hypothetical protein